MPSTNFPSGFANGLTVRGMPLLQMQPGHVFWVNNSTVLMPGQRGGSDSNAGTRLSPFNSLDAAVGHCVAGRGDIIFVGAGHAEAISSATAVVMDVAGVAVIGLGSGSARPTFTLDTANTTTIAVSAADVSFQNCLFIGNFLTIAGCFTLTTAQNFALQSCEFRDTTAAKNFAQIVKSTGAANTVDGLSIVDCFYGSIGTTFASLVLTANDINGLQLHRNTVMSINTDDKAVLIVVSAGVLTNGMCTDNSTIRKNTTNTVAMISVGGSTSSVVMLRNFAAHLDPSGGDINWVVTSGIVGVGNTMTGALAGQGFTIPALDS